VKPRTYIGLAKTRKLVELRRAGVAASVIAERLKISLATVYRLLHAQQPRVDGDIREVQDAHGSQSPGGGASSPDVQALADLTRLPTSEVVDLVVPVLDE
jgi:hypothetical protein